MGVCDVCGNEYDKTFTISMRDSVGTFDCFECAVHAMAPTCPHCGCRIIGHGVECDLGVFCCANCARLAGQPAFVDRV